MAYLCAWPIAWIAPSHNLPTTAACLSACASVSLRFLRVGASSLRGRRGLGGLRFSPKQGVPAHARARTAIRPDGIYPSGICTRTGDGRMLAWAWHARDTTTPANACPHRNGAYGDASYVHIPSFDKAPIHPGQAARSTGDAAPDDRAIHKRASDGSAAHDYAAPFAARPDTRAGAGAEAHGQGDQHAAPAHHPRLTSTASLVA